MQKRGWNDGSSKGLQEERRGRAGHRGQIVTWFDLFDADERQNSRQPTADGRKKRRN